MPLRILAAFTALFVILNHPAAAQERRVPTGAELKLSFAPIVQRVAPAVVNVYAANVVENRNPLLDDPLFRRFFGTPDMPQPATPTKPPGEREGAKSGDKKADEPGAGQTAMERKQIHDASVLMQDGLEEQLRLVLERLTKALVEFRKSVGIGFDQTQIAQIQPLSREILDQRLRALIGEHALHLLL